MKTRKFNYKWCIQLLIILTICISGSLQSQIIYKPLYNNTGIVNYTPNVNLPVGSLGGSADVAMGAASYLIPIELPAGTNGVIPNISISYNSQGSSGYLGYGWQINGLSSITRGLRTIYHDSIAGPVNFTSADRFLLDGNRLVKTEGTYGSNGCHYAKELTDFSRTTSIGNIGSGPAWFKLETKEGLVVEYGNTTDSKFMTESNNDVIVWNINKMIWPDSNYIEFVYEQIGREHRLKEIKYTGNNVANLLPYNKIQFVYAASIFSKPTYEAGNLIEKNHLLQQIVITTENNTPFKTYTFSYGHNNVNEFLVEVAELGSDGTALNPTIFQYGAPAISQISGGAAGYATSQDTDVFTGDYDGDGLTDMALINKEVDDGDIFYTTFSAFRNNPATNDFTFKQSRVISSLARISEAGNTYNFFSSDFTGDGSDDIVYSFASDLSVYANLQMENTLIFSFANAMNTMIEDTIIRPSEEYKYMQSTNRYMITSDFNGDGISDIILILRNITDNYKAYIYYGGISTAYAEFTISGTAVYHPISNWDVKNINVLDFDGDGKSELMITRGSSSEIFTFDQLYQCKSLHAAGFPTEWHLMYFGDFNGDKKTDMLTRAGLDDNNAPWFTVYSKGNQWQEEVFYFPIGNVPQINAQYHGTIIYIADLNGDGMQDIFRGRTASSNDNYYIYYSKGSGFHQVFGSWPYADEAYLASGGDFNGDGRSDMQIKTEGSSSIQGVMFNAFGTELLMIRAKNGYGHETEWNYRRMTEPTSTYMRTASTQHPVATVQSPLYVVYNFARDGELTTRYEYRNMRLHKEGRGLLGFGKVTKYNVATNLYEETEYATTTDTYLHLPALVRYKEGTTTLQTKTYTNEVTQLNNVNYTKLLYHRISNTIDVNLMEGRTITNSHTVDSYGNMMTSLTDVNGIESISESYVFEQYGSFIPNKITSQTTSKIRTGQPSYSKITTYEYNPKGQMTGMRTFDGEPLSVYTQYYYNVTGNQDSTRISAQGVTTRTSASQYDSKGRYVIAGRNTLGQVSTISEYDIRWAKPKVSTGIDGLTTMFEYDAFGRVTSMTMPQGYNVTTTYGWSLSFPERYFVSVQHPGKPNELTRFDRNNRPIEMRTEGYNGAFIYTNTEYDNRGRVSTKTAPYKTGDTPFITTYTYDNFSRVTEESNPHTTTTYSYSYNSGLLTTTTTKVVPLTGNQISSTVTDATGKMISATDPGGTLMYQYHSNGELLSVSMGSTVLVSNTYDNYGRKTSTTDINTGTTTYETDAFSQIIKEINPLGHTTVQTYNVLGQVLTRTGTEGLTQYEYYGAGTGASINKTKKITSFGGDTENMTYDLFGRPATHITTVDAIPFTTSYTYSIYDLLETENYTGGFGVRYTRDANGYIQTIKNADQTHTFYQSPSLNAYLMPTSYTLGSGYQVTRSYNQQYPTSFTSGNSYSMSYVWDYASGNLTSRTIHNQTENFQYDIMNRLIQTTHPAASVTTAYMLNGNITAKTDAGPDYTYHAEKIHAMSGITTPVYPDNINLTAQNIAYTPYQQPATITEGDYRLDYKYGHHYQRNRSILTYQGVEQERIYYMGNHERKIHNGNTYDVYYISAGDGLLAMAVTTNGSGPAYYYTYTDYLGSIQDITTATGLGTIAGAIQNYDAWGRRRNINFQPQYLIDPPEWLIRGYTGHEMLWKFRLINMNGRIYDPVLGRVLSPDNVVSAPASTQGYNRYSYVHNNPLRYTDPDGNIPILATLAIGAAVSALVNGLNNVKHHRNFFDGVGKAAAFGAIGGLVSAGIGALANLAPSALDAAIIQMNLHGLSAGMISFAQGNNALSGFVSGASSSVIGSLTEHLGGGATATLIGGGLAGGIGAAVTGGEFWYGVQQGLITTGLNHIAHRVSNGQQPDPPKKGDIMYDECTGRVMKYTGETWVDINFSIPASGQVTPVDGPVDWLVGGGALKGAFGKLFTTKGGSKVVDEVSIVTKEGVVLPKGAKIPKDFVESPFRSSSYGVIKDGKFVEKLRIDPPTPAGKKGPNFSHYHLDGNSKHLTDNWPWW